MDSILFSLKRAFHKTNAFAATFAEPFGLTPARFDLMYIVLQYFEGTFQPIRQDDLRRILGVSRATVSRMLHSLERRGLIERDVDRIDARHREVSLTQQGLARIIAAVRDVFDAGAVRWGVINIFVRRWWSRASQEKDLLRLERFLRRARRVLGDMGCHYETWDPEYESFPGAAPWQ